MADIFLAHSNHLYFDNKQVRKMQPYPPLGTLSSAACLRRHGFGIALFDTTFDASPEAFQRALARHHPRLFFLCEDNFNFLTKMCLTRQRELGLELVRAAKEAGCAVMVNGSDASDHPLPYLEAGADFVITGEPETTAAELACRMLRGTGPEISRIAGLVWLQAGAPRRTAHREPLADLDALPPPAWDLVDMETYRREWTAAHGYFSVNAVASRGCPYRCNWCAKPIYGQAYHTHSPRRVAREMLWLKENIQPDRLWFADDIFALSPRWTAEFAREVDALGARIPFRMQSRCDLMTRSTVEALARAGCEEVWMGAESGSQKVLDAMEKGIRVSDISVGRANLRAHGIRACFFIQFGYPGEGWEEILETVRMVRGARPDDIGVSVSYPLPGTRFHELVKIQLGQRRNWVESDDLAMMFQGAFTTDFYRLLRDALHLEVDLWNERAAAGSQALLRAQWGALERMRESCAIPHPGTLCVCS